MKRIFAFALAAYSAATFSATLNPVQLLNPTGSSSGQTIVSTGSSSAPGWATVPLSGLSSIAANTVVANATGSSAAPSAFAMPSCSTSSSALNWTTSTGFTCNTAVNAAQLGGATFASPGAIGGTTAGSGAFTTLSASGNDALLYTNTNGQSIPNNTNTTVTTWTKTSDRVNSNFNASTGTFTAPVTGYYQVSAQLTYVSAAGVVGTAVQAIIVANSVTVATGNTSINATGASNMTASVSAVVQMTAGQTLVIQAFQNSGSARTLSTGASFNVLSINRIP